MAGSVADAHLAQCLLHSLFPLGGLHTEIDERQLHVLAYRHLFDEVEALEYEADIALTDGSPVFFPEVAHFCPIELVDTGSGIVEKAEDIEQSGLTASRRPHYGDKFAFVHFERYAIEGYRLYFFCSENLGEVADFNHCFTCFYEVKGRATSRTMPGL